MTHTSDPETGRRATKYRETHARLREATFFFVDRDGLDAAKVDHIAERAGVSPRTFFNYFESKQDALLGVGLLQLDDELMAEHADQYRGADTVESVMGLLFMIGRPVLRDLAAHRHRAHIIGRHPQLMSAQVGHVSKLGGLLTDATVRIMTASSGWAYSEAIEASAHLLLGLCAGAMRSVLPGENDRALHPTLADLERQSVDLVRSTIRRLS